MIRIAFCAVALLTLAACETVEGFGRDVATAGQKVQEVAN